tara:strand:- start:11024 stop:12070 length:1047 start_codon:yes stop_codon:yes gene_type:complete
MKVIQHSKTVEIHLRPNSAKMARIGQGIDLEVIHNKEKIGSAYTKNGAILRGLNKIEERMFLPRILGISEKDVLFEKYVEDYWLNINVTVPSHNREGKGGGLKLQVGFEYDNQADAKKGQKEADKEAIRFEKWKTGLIGKTPNGIRRFKEDFSIRQEVGKPINVNEYILYRYCLVYSVVALDIKYIDNSAKIRFYILDSSASLKADHAKLMAKKNATLAFSELLGDRDKVGFVIDVMKKEISGVQQMNKKEYSVNTDDEKDILLDAIVSAYPNKFLSVVNDDNLVLKSFVEQCVNFDILRRIPNTDTIYYGDNTKIGNSVNEAVMFLKEEQNLETRQQIKARLTTAKK